MSEVTKKKRARAAQRANSTKSIEKAKETLQEFDGTDDQQRQSLQVKKRTLLWMGV